MTKWHTDIKSSVRVTLNRCYSKLKQSKVSSCRVDNRNPSSGSWSLQILKYPGGQHHIFFCLVLIMKMLMVRVYAEMKCWSVSMTTISRQPSLYDRRWSFTVCFTWRHQSEEEDVGARRDPSETKTHWIFFVDARRKKKSDGGVTSGFLNRKIWEILNWQRSEQQHRKDTDDARHAASFPWAPHSEQLKKDVNTNVNLRIPAEFTVCFWFTTPGNIKGPEMWISGVSYRQRL